jgi:hypothetical protein
LIWFNCQWRGGGGGLSLPTFYKTRKTSKKIRPQYGLLKTDKKCAKWKISTFFAWCLWIAWKMQEQIQCLLDPVLLRHQKIHGLDPGLLKLRKIHSLDLGLKCGRIQGRLWIPTLVNFNCDAEWKWFIREKI